VISYLADTFTAGLHSDVFLEGFGAIPEEGLRSGHPGSPAKRLLKR